MASSVKRVNINDIREMKRSGEKITMLTAYDYSLINAVFPSFWSAIVWEWWSWAMKTPCP
jgi:hypothetical protein